MTPRGFPGPLPAGEALLWQGAPTTRVLARMALHTRGLLLYFAALIAASAATGRPHAALVLAGLGIVPLVLAYAYAWAVARATVYSITNRRVVMHIGLALPVTLNLPLAQIAAIDLHANKDGSGDVCFTLTGRNRFAYVVLWPHARPWRFSPAQPTMRGLGETRRPVAILSGLMAPLAETVRLPLAA